MKNSINFILAAFFLATAMSITSCTKENLKPENITVPVENNTPSEEFKTTLRSSLDTLFYEGNAFTVPFKVLENGTSTLKVKSKECEGAELNITLDGLKGGVITVTPTKNAGTAKVVITNGKTDATCKISFDTYRLNVYGIPKSFGDGEQFDFTLNLDTNIPEDRLDIKSDEWIKTARNGSEISVSILGNHDARKRQGTLVIAESEGILPAYEIAVSQDYILENKPGMVQFIDRSFKTAVLDIADTNKDKDISQDEALALQEMDIVGRGVKDLTGLDAFRNLEKLDARDNDIEDANIVSALPRLHWLDLRGNANLKCFDVTGCSFYFDWCRFNINDELKYTQYKRQVGVCIGERANGYKYSNDPTGEHAIFLDDERKTTDWSEQNKLILVSGHTKGNGKNKIVFTGAGYTDFDVKTGTFQRIMEEACTTMFERATNLNKIKEYFDIYFMVRIAEKHNQWLGTKNGYTNERKQIYKYAYNLACGFSEDHEAYDNRKQEKYNYNVLTESIDIYPNINNIFPGAVEINSNQPQNVRWMVWGKDNDIYSDNYSVYSDNNHVSADKYRFLPEEYEDFVKFVKESNGIQ